MERTVNTKEELKKAIQHRAPTIIIGNDRLAKKITRFQKVRSEDLQATEEMSASAGGEATVAMPNVPPNAAPSITWAPNVAAFAIMVLGGLAYYSLTRNYDICLEGGGSIKFKDGEPRIGGRFKFILKTPLLFNNGSGRLRS
jgi:hypothetical protein